MPKITNFQPRQEQTFGGRSGSGTTQRDVFNAALAVAKFKGAEEEKARAKEESADQARAVMSSGVGQAAPGTPGNVSPQYAAAALLAGGGDAQPSAPLNLLGAGQPGGFEAFRGGLGPGGGEPMFDPAGYEKQLRELNPDLSDDAVGLAVAAESIEQAEAEFTRRHGELSQDVEDYFRSIPLPPMDMEDEAEIKAGIRELRRTLGELPGEEDPEERAKDLNDARETFIGLQDSLERTRSIGDRTTWRAGLIDSILAEPTLRVDDPRREELLALKEKVHRTPGMIPDAFQAALQKVEYRADGDFGEVLTPFATQRTRPPRQGLPANPMNAPPTAGVMQPMPGQGGGPEQALATLGNFATSPLPEAERLKQIKAFLGRFDETTRAQLVEAYERLVMPAPEPEQEPSTEPMRPPQMGLGRSKY